MKRIGFDLDGVLCEFIPHYQRLFTIVTGKNYFVQGDNVDPPVWNWPQLRGYTDADVAAVWRVINASTTFWEDLPETQNMCAMREKQDALLEDHEVYFITNRSGVRVRQQTELWLRGRFNRFSMFTPMVLITRTGSKGAMARALILDAYIDDNYDNLIDVVNQSPGTKPYLLDRKYNREWWSFGGKDIVNEMPVRDDRVEAGRVCSVAEMLRREGI